MEWVSVEDKLPDKDDYYIVLFQSGKPVEASFRVSDKTFYDPKEFYGFHGVMWWLEFKDDERIKIQNGRCKIR